MSGKYRPHRDSIPDRSARSQSLYRLSYPAHYNSFNFWYFVILFMLFCYSAVVRLNARQKLSMNDGKLVGNFRNKTIKMLNAQVWTYVCLGLSQFN